MSREGNSCPLMSQDCVHLCSGVCNKAAFSQFMRRRYSTQCISVFFLPLVPVSNLIVLPLCSEKRGDPWALVGDVNQTRWQPVAQKANTDHCYIQRGYGLSWAAACHVRCCHGTDTGNQCIGSYASHVQKKKSHSMIWNYRCSVFWSYWLQLKGRSKRKWICSKTTCLSGWTSGYLQPCSLEHDFWYKNCHWISVEMYN